MKPTSEPNLNWRRCRGFGEDMMPTYEVRGPDVAGKYWVVEVACEGAFLSEIPLNGSYSKKEKAQAAADKLNKR